MTKLNVETNQGSEWYQKRVEQMDALRARIAAELGVEIKKS